MRIRISYPAQPMGTVQIPPSKSMAHRAIICACLAHGRSIISNIEYSNDIKATIQAMQHLGVNITAEANRLIIYGGLQQYSGKPVDCGESGSTLRFIIPLFSLTGRAVNFIGAKRLFERPQAIYENIFKAQGLAFTQSEGIAIEGRLQAGTYELDGNVSSQFISGLLFALPLLQGDSVIKVKPPLESLSYIKLTLAALAGFGIEIVSTNSYTYHIRGGQEYRPINYAVEGDYSQFAFMAVLGAINGDISCTGMDMNSLQGDKAVLATLERAGVGANNFHVQKSDLIATDTDLSDCPDLGPILCILAMYSKGKSRIYNAGRLRIKESDRIEAMQQELRKFGVDIETTTDEIIITGKDKYMGGVVVDGHNDHRIVMSLAVAAALCKDGLVIEGAEAVNKSYPSFFDDLARIGVAIISL